MRHTASVQRPETELHFPDPPLTSAGVVLRPLSSPDVEWLAETCNDPELSRYVPVLPIPYSVVDAEQFVARGIEGWATGTHAPFVITDASNGHQLGMIELHIGPEESVAGVGYWLCRSARGRGAAAIALRLTAGWAIRTLGVERLHVTADPDNHASQRVAERAGFVREGVLRGWLRTPEGRRDRVMFSLLPSDLD